MTAPTGFVIAAGECPMRYLAVENDEISWTDNVADALFMANESSCRQLVMLLELSADDCDFLELDLF